MFRSLRFRMAASHATVLAVILVALGGAGFLLLSASLDRSATIDLLAAARQQANRIREQGQASPPQDSDVPSTAAIRVAVFTPDGRLVGEGGEVPTWLRPAPQQVRDLTVAGERTRVVTIDSSLGTQSLATIVAGRSLVPEERLLHRVRLLLLFGGALAVAFSLVTGWWLAGRAVRPVQLAYDAQAGFAADASHELRTPLTFIRSGVEVLAENEPNLGSQVLSEIDYLTGLIHRLLMLARAEQGKMTLDREPIDLAAVCRSASSRSQSASGTRLDLDGDEARALGDRVATEAALDAVLENVGVHGGGEAVIRWGCDGERSLISVEDHGPGLPPRLQRRVFERFARADLSRSRSTGGAGLGLALARALVEAEGGSMWLDDTPGGGVTVRIALPVP
jgi:signal transduction histidine kinase